MDLAQGDAIAFIDADDWWTPSHLENANRAFGGGVDFVVSGIQLYNLDAHEPMESYEPPEILYRDPIKELFTHSHIMTSSCVAIRTSLVRKVGAFEPTLRIGEDRDYWMRCAETGARFVGSGEITCFYSKHATSTMAKTLLWAEQEVLFHEKHFRFAGVPVRLRRECLAHVLTNYGRLVRATDRSAARRAFARALRLSPSARGLAQWIRSLG
jgi:glycosyltransferase involved in cell wall biosynthesis